MDHANYRTAKLADLDDRYYYGVSCQSCMRKARMSLVRLRAVLGDDYAVVKVLTRLRCRTCSSKQVTVTFLGPHQAVGESSGSVQGDGDISRLNRSSIPSIAAFAACCCSAYVRRYATSSSGKSSSRRAAINASGIVVAMGSNSSAKVLPSANMLALCSCNSVPCWFA